MSSWETDGNDRTYVCSVGPTHVSVGDTSGNRFTDAFTSCTHAEFLAGRYQDVVRSHHGEAVLQEVLEAVRAHAAG